MESYPSDNVEVGSTEKALEKWMNLMRSIRKKKRRFRFTANLPKRFKTRDTERPPLQDVLSATNNFSDENLIAESAIGKVYKGQWYENSLNLVIQRMDCKYGQGDAFDNIAKFRHLCHKNIASIVGYCDENHENIIIYDAFRGILSQHLSDPALNWARRLDICFGVAQALNSIHYDVIHCDINSSKIILDEDWQPKIYGFELSSKYPQSWRHRLLFSRYFDTDSLTPKYDVYSFGVLLLEVLCGRKPMITSNGVEEELDDIIDPNLRKQMDTQSLSRFKELAYKCLKQQLVQRPTMDQVVKELKEVLEFQWEHANLIPLKAIKKATNGFSKACFVGSGGYANVYRAELEFVNSEGLSLMEEKSKDELPKITKTVAIKRILDCEKGKQGFLTEIELLPSCKHPNIVSLLGFSRENNEMILVYEYAFKGSLGDYLVSNDKTTLTLTWAQRLQICLDIARGISYLHDNMEGKQRIIHRDIKSDNILLDENLNAKLADFGLSKSHPIDQQVSTIYTKNIAGTEFYIDPEYLTKAKFKRETDAYSLGVVLFEVLSGKMAYDPVYTNENDMGLAHVARRRFNEGTLKELIDPKMIKEDDEHIFTFNKGPNQRSFNKFSKIAYQCLAETQAKRPTMEVVINELQDALNLQGETVVLLRFRLSDLRSATKNFAETYCICSDTNGAVYKAELDQFGSNSSVATKEKYNSEPSKKHTTVAIKRITNSKGGQGIRGFFVELERRARNQHPNIASLVGFCDEDDEMILVYEHVSNRSLDDYLKSFDQMDTFTWTDRLHMCLEIARGLNHLHTKMAKPQRIIHGDIRSANILLDKNSEAKIAYFGISKLHPANQKVHIKVYEDPEYETRRELKIEYDVYSFGVILLEIFCGKVAYDPVYIKNKGLFEILFRKVTYDKGLASIAHQRFNDGTIQTMMDPKLKEEMSEGIFTSLNKKSMDTFLKIAFQCLGEAAERPTVEVVIRELESALNIQVL